MSHLPDSQDYLDDGLDADFHALADRLDPELAKATDPVNKVVERFSTVDKKLYALPKPGLNSSQQLDRVVGSHWIPSMEDYELDQAAQEEWLPAAPAKVGTDHVLLEKDETHTYELPYLPLSSPAAAVDEESAPALKRPLISASGSKDTTAATINPDGSLKAFVRGPFPREVQPRVDVQGLSTRTVIKTCFRIGEALQVGIAGQRPAMTAYPSDVLVELYARVSFSERLGRKQNFEFLDLFHDGPPFLSGVFEGWRRCELWDNDSAAFLKEEGLGKMVRLVGRIKKKEEGGTGAAAFFIQILSVQEAGWEDVKWTRKAVCEQ